jgi:hypothetical protein
VDGSFRTGAQVWRSSTSGTCRSRLCSVVRSCHIVIGRRKDEGDAMKESGHIQMTLRLEVEGWLQLKRSGDVNHVDDIKSQMPRLLNRSYRPDSSAISTGNSVECHILSTGSLLQKQSVMKKDLGNRGAGLSVSQLQWTLTGMRDINQGVRAATVFASSLIAASGYSTNRTTFQQM